MARLNIRTINGAKHNGALPDRYKRVQNRAAAVIDAYIAMMTFDDDNDNNDDDDNKSNKVQQNLNNYNDLEITDDKVEELKLVAHLHGLSLDTIKKDLFGDHIDIVKRFGTRSSEKIKKVIKLCLKEIVSGINAALVSVAYHIPYVLLKSMEEHDDINKAVMNFLHQVN